LGQAKSLQSPQSRRLPTHMHGLQRGKDWGGPATTCVARVLLASHALSEVEVKDETCEIASRTPVLTCSHGASANRLAAAQGSLSLSPMLADEQGDVSEKVDRRDLVVRLPKVAGTWWHNLQASSCSDRQDHERSETYRRH